MRYTLLIIVNLALMKSGNDRKHQRDERYLMRKTIFMKFLFYLFSLSFLFSCNTDKKKEVLNESQIYERAIKWYQQKQYVEAKSCLDTLILLNPVNGEYFFKRGYAKTMLLNMDRSAMEDYLKAIEYNYRNKKSAYLNIGKIYRGYGYYDSAINLYNQAWQN